MTTRTIIYKQASKQASKQADTAHFLIGDNIKHTQAHSARFAAGGGVLFACRNQAMCEYWVCHPCEKTSI